MLHIVAQNLIELWVVATRPLRENGLGMTPVEAALELARIKGMFLFLPETPAIYPVWEALVTRHEVSGKPAHDARLVAAMQVHGLTAGETYATRLTWPPRAKRRAVPSSGRRPAAIRIGV
jgi:hypothetical protein